jgi:hypothetical protein
MPTAKTTSSTLPVGSISANANTLNQLLAGISGNVGGIGGLPAGTVSYPNTLAGAPSQMGQGAYGAVPGAANPQQTQATAVGGNEAIEQQLAQLTGQLDTATAAGAMAGLSQNLPGAAGLISQAGTNVGQELGGQLPADVLSFLNQQAAERGAGSGLAGSPEEDAAALRAMGLTSLGMEEQGQQDLGSLINDIPKGLQFDPSTMLVTPQQQLQQQQLANDLAAAPDPTMAAEANLAALAKGVGTGGGLGGTPTTPAAGTGTTTPGAASNPDGYGAYTGGWLTGTNTGSPYGAAGTIPAGTTTPATNPTSTDDWLNQFYDASNPTSDQTTSPDYWGNYGNTLLGTGGATTNQQVGPNNWSGFGDPFETQPILDEFGNVIDDQSPT